MLVSKLFPSACSVPGAWTGCGITFSSPWESQESTLLPTLPGENHVRPGGAGSNGGLLLPPTET